MGGEVGDIIKLIIGHKIRQISIEEVQKGSAPKPTQRTILNSDSSDTTSGPMEQLRSHHKWRNTHKRWSDEEEIELKLLFRENVSEEEIGKRLGRSVGGIRGRLFRMGLIDDWAPPDDAD